jgi:hypothetical protein
VNIRIHVALAVLLVATAYAGSRDAGEEKPKVSVGHPVKWRTDAGTMGDYGSPLDFMMEK